MADSPVNLQWTTPLSPIQNCPFMCGDLDPI